MGNQNLHDILIQIKVWSDVASYQIFFLFLPWLLCHFYLDVITTTTDVSFFIIYFIIYRFERPSHHISHWKHNLIPPSLGRVGKPLGHQAKGLMGNVWWYLTCIPSPVYHLYLTDVSNPPPPRQSAPWWTGWWGSARGWWGKGRGGGCWGRPVCSTESADPAWVVLRIFFFIWFWYLRV